MKGKLRLVVDNTRRAKNPAPLHPNCRCILLPYMGDKPMNDVHEMYIEGVKAALLAVRENGYIRQYQPQYSSNPNAIEYTISNNKLTDIEARLTGGK